VWQNFSPRLDTGKMRIDLLETVSPAALVGVIRPYVTNNVPELLQSSLSFLLDQLEKIASQYDTFTELLQFAKKLINYVYWMTYLSWIATFLLIYKYLLSQFLKSPQDWMTHLSYGLVTTAVAFALPTYIRRLANDAGLSKLLSGGKRAWGAFQKTSIKNTSTEVIDGSGSKSEGLIYTEGESIQELIPAAFEKLTSDATNDSDAYNDLLAMTRDVMSEIDFDAVTEDEFNEFVSATSAVLSEAIPEIIQGDDVISATALQLLNGVLSSLNEGNPQARLEDSRKKRELALFNEEIDAEVESHEEEEEEEGSSTTTTTTGNSMILTTKDSGNFEMMRSSDGTTLPVMTLLPSGQMEHWVEKLNKHEPMQLFSASTRLIFDLLSVLGDIEDQT